MSQSLNRRGFLAQLGTSGAALAAGSWLASMGYAQASHGPARAVINQNRIRSNLDRRLLGSFLEHLGRAVYTGVYEPGSPLADERGFRKDVVAEIKELLRQHGTADRQQQRPLRGHEPRLRQTIYYPYRWALKHAHGRVLDLLVESETYPIKADGLRADFARNEEVPFVDVAATLDPRNRQLSVFMLNRDLESERELVLEFRDPTPTRVLSCETITGPDLKAANTFAQPRNVVPRPLDAPGTGTRMTFKLPARSYTVTSMATA